MQTRSLAPQLRDPGEAASAFRSIVEREFELVRPLDAPRSGEQSVGERWLAVRRKDQRKVVLSTFPRDSLLGDQTASLERILAAAVPVSSAHPHLAPVVAAGVDGEQCYVAAEYIDGDDLATLVAQTGPLPLDAACECLRQALQGLDHAHGNGVAHGDLKPADLLLDLEGNVKIYNLAWAGSDRRVAFADAVAADLRGLARTLRLLLGGEHGAGACNCCDGDDACGGAFDLASVPPSASSLHELYVRLSNAGSAGGVSSAREALGALDAAWTAIEQAASQEIAAEDRPQPAAGGQDPHAAAASTPVEPSAESEQRAARRFYWLAGSVAVTAAALAAATYFLWG